MGDAPRLSRRRLLELGAALPALPMALAACVEPSGSATPTASPRASAAPTSSATPNPSPSVAPVTSGRVLFRNAALLEPPADRLAIGRSILVEDGLVRWIRPADDEEDPGPAGGLEVVDAEGATVVPGMVDAHAHLAGAGGANWIARFGDATPSLLQTAERNASLAWQAGVRWLRDVGSPVRADLPDSAQRAVAIYVRDALHGRPQFPAIRAAGSWLTRPGTLHAGLAVEAASADELVAAAMRQLDDGADLVKLYLAGPDPDTSPWTASEVRRVVDLAHGRGARVAAHAGRLAGARVGVAAGVDSIEHGFVLDADLVAQMVAGGVRLVTTLTVFHSWLSFGSTTSDPFFAGPGAQRRIGDELEAAEASVRLADAAGMTFAAGTDFGGGSSRANQLAWEVQALVRAGVAPHRAVAAVTRWGGELLGEPEAGVLHEGGPAAFFLVHGDPLSDPAALWRVWRHAPG